MTDPSSPSNPELQADEQNPPPPGVPAGWYPTPAGKQRYWDGSQWTNLPSTDAETLATPVAANPSQTRRLFLIVGSAAVVLIVLIVGIVLVVKAATPTTFTATGTFELLDPGATGVCDGAGGYTDIQSNAQVKITNVAGHILAIGQLNGGKPKDGECDFNFTVHGVPLGQHYYGIEITHRGIVQYSAKEMQSGTVDLTLGG